MYYIVGSDNQSHGPVDESTLKEWIAQGRAIAQTQACKEGNSEWKALSLFPEFATALENSPPPPDSGGDATGGLIPYKNKHALVGYYMSIGGLLLMCIPVLGLGYGIAVLYCGIKGRKNAKEHPEVKGSVHAWIAIIGGVAEILVGAFTTFMLIISLLESM